MINIKKINYLDIIDEFSLKHHLDWLNNEYLAERNGRSDIFTNLDIFEENTRSKNKIYKNFDLFNVVNEIKEDTVILVGLYLELLKYWGEIEALKYILYTYSNRYKDNKVIFYWNHDTDFAKYNYLTESLNNAIILNYNTSKKTKNDIILPFWTYDINDNVKVLPEKKNFCNMVCTINNTTRLKLFNVFANKPGYIVGQGLPYDQFKDIIMSSVFTFCPRGIGLSSYRFFETMRLGSIPVLFADQVVLPYEDEINYNEMIIRIPESKCNDFCYINDILHNTDYNMLLNNILKNVKYFRLDGIQEYIYRKIK